MKEFRICALCRHFQHKESGHEFPGIADTAYEVYRCGLLGWTRREDALMESSPQPETASSSGHYCPFWEGWEVEENPTYRLDG